MGVVGQSAEHFVYALGGQENLCGPLHHRLHKHPYQCFSFPTEGYGCNMQHSTILSWTMLFGYWL